MQQRRNSKYNLYIYSTRRRFVANTVIRRSVNLDMVVITIQRYVTTRSTARDMLTTNTAVTTNH